MPKKKIEEMKNNPDTAEMDAVKNDRFIVLSGHVSEP